MPAAVRVTRLEHSAAALRHAAVRTRDAAAARRMLSIALVLEGGSRSVAAAQCGMDRQTLRDWVHRYNAGGLDGLSDRRSPGRPPRLTPDWAAAVAGWVRQGPELERHGVVRWRRVDLSAEIERHFGVKLAARTVGRLLHRLGFSRVSVRPYHPRKDAEAQASFKKTSPSGPLPPCLPQPAASRSRSGSRTKPGSASRAA
jgi:transposase